MSLDNSKTRTIRDKEFARRLEQACDGHPQCPPFNFGRLSWISKQFDDRLGAKVSSETVRKWNAGESRPRPEKMRFLAQILAVDEAWLALGVSPEIQPRDQRTRSIAVSGAVNLLTAAIQLEGGACAFPAEDDPRAGYVSVYAIIRGAQYAFHAALAQDSNGGTYHFVLPVEYQDCMVIGIVPRGDLTWDFLLMEDEIIDARKVRKGGYFEVEVKRKGDTYTSGKDKWPRIRTFAQRL